MGGVRKNLRDEDFENVDAGEPHILIPNEGNYPARFDYGETKHYTSWGEKLIFHWIVFLSQDQSQSVSLNRYYNLERSGGGQFKFGPLHDYRKDWIAARRGKVPVDRTRLSISIWKKSLFVVEVQTVRNDGRGRPLSPSFYWSKVARVIRPIEEGECWEG